MAKHKCFIPAHTTQTLSELSQFHTQIVHVVSKVKIRKIMTEHTQPIQDTTEKGLLAV
jgi:hypothetical protein